MVRSTGWLLVAFVLGLALAPGCDDFPKDPQDTLSDVRGGTMRVGVSETKPWVWREGEEPRGVETDLVRELAEELGAEVEWVWGSQDEHLAALEHWQLDLAIGGLTQATPWSKRIGMTRPFVTRPTPPPRKPTGAAPTSPRCLSTSRSCWTDNHLQRTPPRAHF